LTLLLLSLYPAFGTLRHRLDPVYQRSGVSMEAFLVSITTVGVAEIGDRTQLLSLVLAARYRRPWPIIAGILCATLANHGVAGFVGVWFGSLLKPQILGIVVGVSMIAMALWTLKPDTLNESTGATSAMGAFLATLTSFFIAEIGDKTQIATLALAAAYPNLLAVVAGTTAGMLLANVPVVFMGKAFADRLPLKAIHYSAAALFVILGIVFLVRALWKP
jgi:putative Ca2+/H+ antiporter (TMEM165/GDT1 family)